MENEEEMNLEAFDVPLREWISQERSLSQWIDLCYFGRTRREIKRRMRDFLNTFSESSLPSHHLSHNLTTTSSAKRKREHEEELEEELASNGRLVYHDRFISLKISDFIFIFVRIRKMCLHNKSSLEISYTHLLHHAPILGDLFPPFFNLSSSVHIFNLSSFH